MKQIAIYTAIFADYDTLKLPPQDTGCDYFCFTDNHNLRSDIYKIRLQSRRFANPARDARYYKILSHQVLPQYRYSLWVDASASFKFNNIQEFVRSTLK